MIKHFNTLLLAILAFTVFLLVNQCSLNNRQDQIIKQNELAMKDSSYSAIKTITELKEELAKKDSALSVKVNTIVKEKITSVTKTVVKYKRDTTVLTNTKLIYTDSTILFNSIFNDSIIKLSIDSHIKYKYDTITESLKVDTAYNILNKLDLNFGIGLIKSVDNDGFLRVRSQAYYLNSVGGFSKEIPNNKLNLRTQDIVIDNTKKESRWALTLSPASVGLFLTPVGVNLGIGPSAAFSYVIRVK